MKQWLRKFTGPNLSGKVLYKIVSILIPSVLKRRDSEVLNYRGTRIHAFVNEALSLVPTSIEVLDEIPEVDSHRLKGEFRKYGSDKEDRHSYAWVYSALLGENLEPKILEIGLGSLNGFPYGGLAPGGSMKAWRGGYPQATIVGADIDEEAVNVIEEIGIVLDQTSDVSLQNLKKTIEKIGQFDLIVDDGFHDPHANMRTLLNLYPCVKPGGSYVIEDVHYSLINFWRAIGISLPGRMTIYDLRNQRRDCDDNILLVFSF